MAKQTQQDIPPLLPLEYCRIERAARVLGCEVEDLIHWGAVGSIRLYVRLGWLSCHLSSLIRVDDPFEGNGVFESQDLTSVERAHLEGIITLLKQGSKLGSYTFFHHSHAQEGDGDALVFTPEGLIEFRLHGFASGLNRP